MKKKRELTPQEYEIYKKQHDYDDVVAAEESKISNEKEVYTELQEKSKRQIKRKIQELRHFDDIETMEDDFEDPQEERIANRTIRNAKTHKNRLGGLKEYEES